MLKLNIIFAFLVIFVLNNVCCGSKKNVTEEEEEDPHKRTPIEKKLLEKLLDNYDSEYIPMVEPGQPLEIGVTVSILNFPIGRNPISHLTSPKTRWIYKWIDHHLTWNPADYEGVKILKHVDSYYIWIPDLVLLYSPTSSDHNMAYVADVMINSDGEVTLYSSGHLDLDCEVFDFNYPFEEHRCDAIVGSLKYDKDELKITFNKTDLSKYRKSPQYELLNFKGEPFIDTDPILGVPKSLIYFVLTVRRLGQPVRDDAVALTGFVSFLLILSRFVKLGLMRIVFMLGLFIPLTHIMDKFRRSSYDVDENDGNRPLMIFIYSVAKLVCFILTCDVLIMYIMEICARHTDCLVSRVLPFLEKLEPVLRLSPTKRYFSSSGVAGGEIMNRGGGDQEQLIPGNDWKALNLLVALLDGIIFIWLCIALFIVYLTYVPEHPGYDKVYENSTIFN